MERERFELVFAFLCWMLPFLLKAQDLPQSCWFGAPYIDEAAVTSEISVVKKPISATHFNWSIQATVSWQKPVGFESETDLYVVSLRKIEDEPIPENEELCAITRNEITVDDEVVTFPSLSFGFLYEFKLLSSHPKISYLHLRGSEWPNYFTPVLSLHNFSERTMTAWKSTDLQEGQMNWYLQTGVSVPHDRISEIGYVRHDGLPNTSNGTSYDDGSCINCYQATWDEEFCSTVDVRYSGAPLDPLLNSMCFNETSQSIEVEISWLPPIQINGILSFFELLVTSPSDNSFPDSPFKPPPSPAPPIGFPGGFGPPISGHQVIVYMPSSFQEGDKITTRLTSLRENELYFVTITPIVATIDSMSFDGGSEQGGSRGTEFNPGLEVEMSFLTETNSNDSAIEIFPCGELLEMPTTEIFDEPPVYNQVTGTTSSAPRTTTKAPDGKNEMNGKGPTTEKLNPRGSGKTKDTTKAISRGGSGIMGAPHEQPITTTGIVIVIVATLLVTILIVTTLIVGVHCMRGAAPESPTKLGNMNGSGRTNGKSPEECGTPLKENV